MPLFEWGVWLLSLALVLSAVRCLMFFGVVSVAIFQRCALAHARRRRNYAAAAWDRRPANWRRPHRRRTWRSRCSGPEARSIYRWVNPPLSPPGGTQPGFGPSIGGWAEAATAFLRSTPPPGRMLNLSMGLGDDVIFWVPGLPVFVDSRLESYPPDFLRAVMDAQSDDSARAGRTDRPASTRSGCSPSHARPLARARVVALLHAGWRAVYADSAQRHRRASDGHARDRAPTPAAARDRSCVPSPAISRRRRRCAASKKGTSRRSLPRWDRATRHWLNAAREKLERDVGARPDRNKDASLAVDRRRRAGRGRDRGRVEAGRASVAGLWQDETQIVWQAEGGWTIVRDKLGDPAQLVLFGYVEALFYFPGSPRMELWLRLPAVLGGIASGLLRTDWASGPVGKGTGLMAFVAMIGSPEMIKLATQARPYTWAVAACLASLLGLARWLETGRRRDGLLFAIASALVVHLHLLFATFAIVPGFFVLRRARRGQPVNWRGLLGWLGLTALLLMPLLVLLRRVSQGPDPSAVGVPNLRDALADLFPGTVLFSLVPFAFMLVIMGHGAATASLGAASAGRGAGVAAARAAGVALRCAGPRAGGAGGVLAAGTAPAAARALAPPPPDGLHRAVLPPHNRGAGADRRHAVPGCSPRGWRAGAGGLLVHTAHPVRRPHLVADRNRHQLATALPGDPTAGSGGHRARVPPVESPAVERDGLAARHRAAAVPLFAGLRLPRAQSRLPAALRSRRVDGGFVRRLADTDLANAPLIFVAGVRKHVTIEWIRRFFEARGYRRPTSFARASGCWRCGEPRPGATVRRERREAPRDDAERATACVPDRPSSLGVRGLRRRDDRPSVVVRISAARRPPSARGAAFVLDPSRRSGLRFRRPVPLDVQPLPGRLWAGARRGARDAAGARDQARDHGGGHRASLVDGPPAPPRGGGSLVGAARLSARARVLVPVGLLRWIVAVPLFLLALPSTLSYAQRPTPRGGVGVAAAGATLFFAHGLILLLFLAVAGAAVVAAARPRRRALTALLPLLVPIGLAVPWRLTVPRVETNLGVLSHARPWAFFWLRPIEWLSLSTGSSFEPVATGFGCAAVALLVAAGLRPSRQRRRWVPFAVAAACYAFMPWAAVNTAYLYQRFAVFLIPLALPVSTLARAACRRGGCKQQPSRWCWA